MTGQLFPELGATYTAEFRLSITRALVDQLVDALAKLEPAPLVSQLDQVQSRPGVYELFVDNELVYVGKTSKSLQARLAKHRRKLSGRSKIDLHKMNFRCLYVYEDLDAASETMLLRKYKDQGGAPWNTNGFGNNDPGRNRDDTLVKANHFDAIYPINLDLMIESNDPTLGGVKHKIVDTYLKALKTRLPFLLRYERSPERTRGYQSAMVEIPLEDLTARDLIRLALEALPEGWQATALPGYVILYPEDRTYDSARVVWRKQGGAVAEMSGPALLDDPGEINEGEVDD